MADYPIAITLGASTCSVAMWTRESVELLYNEAGHSATPAYVAYTDDGVLVGEAAQSQQAANPSNTIYDIKRFIGRTSIDQSLSSLPFRLVRSEFGSISVEVTQSGTKRFLPAAQVLSVLYRKLKEVAEGYIGQLVTRAVLTVPAYFNDSQRTDVRNAAVLAGLQVMRIFNEPSAVVIGCMPASECAEMKFMVCKWGGFQLDVTMLLVEDGIFEIVANGNTSIGGTQMDAKIEAHVRTELLKQCTAEELDRPVTRYALRRACEAAKRTLTNAEEASVEVQLESGAVIVTELSRVTFEALIADLLQSACDLIDRQLLEARWPKADLSAVLITGGTCCVPSVRRTISQHMRRELLAAVWPFSNAPTLGPARGAAMQSAILCGTYNNAQTRDVMLVDCTQLALSVAVHSTDMAGALSRVVLHRGTTIPVRRTVTFSTATDNQTVARVDVYEGEYARASLNRPVTSVLVTHIPPAPKGVPIIEVTLDLNADWMLRVEARDLLRPANCVSHHVILDSSTPQDLERLLADSDRLRAADGSDEAALAARERLSDYLGQCKSYIATQNRSDQRTAALSEVCETTQRWLALHALTLLRAHSYKFKLELLIARVNE